MRIVDRYSEIDYKIQRIEDEGLSPDLVFLGADKTADQIADFDGWGTNIHRRPKLISTYAQKLAEGTMSSTRNIVIPWAGRFAGGTAAGWITYTGIELARGLVSDIPSMVQYGFASIMGYYGVRYGQGTAISIREKVSQSVGYISKRFYLEF